MQLYYTPAALVYLTQVSMAVVFGVHFAVSARLGREVHTGRLAAVYLLLALGAGILTAEAVLVDGPRLVASALKYPIFALAMTAVLDFSYRFPRQLPQRERGRRLIMTAATVFAVFEAALALYRIWRLQSGHVDYQLEFHDFAMIVLCGMIPLSFLRQLHQLEVPRRRLFAVLRRPNREQYVLLTFVAAFAGLTLLATVSLLRGLNLVPGTLANAAVALGMLSVIFTTAVVYVNGQPETTTLMFRVVGVTMATILATLGVLSWYVALLISPQIDSRLLTRSALRFAPNSSGGYTVASTTFNYRQPSGAALPLREGAPHDCAPVDFAVTYFGIRYETIYVCNDGTISFGSAARFNTYQRNYGSGTPLFMAMLSDLDAESGRGAVTVERVDEQLVVSWHDLPSFYDERRIYRFQAWLASDGTVTVQYAQVPQLGQFEPDERPAAGSWAVGAVPGRFDRAVQPINIAALPVVGTPRGVVHDFWLQYRTALSDQMRPFAAGIVAVSLFIILIFPQLFERSLLQPLAALVTAVGRMQAGDYRTRVPMTAPDEIGFLTAAYNRMADELGEHVENLERRVIQRTAELDRANEQLQAEMAERVAAEERLVQEQRRLAALEERERLGRDLHDSLGQTFGSIALQAQTTQNLLEMGNISHALRTLARIDAAARRGHAEVRDLITDLRETIARSFWPTLVSTCEQVAADGQVRVDLQIDEPWDAGLLAPMAAANLLRICQEALTNAQRHAGATAIRLQVLRDGSTLRVMIEDNGCGMQIGTDESAHGHGLLTMRERAEEIGGRLLIDSQPDGGTRVTVVVPTLRDLMVPVDAGK